MIRRLLALLDALRGTEPCHLCAATVRTALMTEHLDWHYGEARALAALADAGPAHQPVHRAGLDHRRNGGPTS